MIDQVKRFRPNIAFNLVEPLLNNEILDFVNYVTETGLRCSLTTNGYLLENFANDLVKANLTTLNISIDGPSEIHNKIRGVSNSYEKAYAGVQKVRASKNIRPTPILNVVYTISNYNDQYLKETADSFKKIGINKIIFTHLNFINEEMADAHNEVFRHVCKVVPSSTAVINPKNMDVTTLYEQVKIVKTNYPNFAVFTPNINTFNDIETYYHKPEIFLTKRKCTTPWTHVQILSNGDIRTSSRCFNIVMGNIYTDNLLENWNNIIICNFRKEIRKIGVTPACSRCCGIF
jgi:MoaA/NifB/PqqE/SkfB family radical SAM enzyme